MIRLIVLFIIISLGSCATDLMKDNQCILDWETEKFTCHKKSTGRVFYTGEMIFVNEISYKHGIGKEFYEDGSLYEGSFEYGVRNGKGKYIFPSVASCSSMWKEDRQFGEVTCEYFEKEIGHLRTGQTDGAGNWVGETVYTFPSGEKIVEFWDNGTLINILNK